MSVPVAPTRLEAAARERGPLAYVFTVGEDGAPHVVQADAQVSGDEVVAIVGSRTAANARARARVCLLFPSRHDHDRNLIIDGVVAVEATPDDRAFRLRLTPTRAVLHRAVPAPDPTASPCGSDCVPIPLTARPDVRTDRSPAI
ncbi:MAG TPA: pyridoxamine 5'-phosphate oxidase family protein [Methylomirabilota bacterium]|nr:pyridoxamine 5'-phosphate oxidase family protein [Methylomirabilota bacterium]